MPAALLLTGCCRVLPTLAMSPTTMSIPSLCPCSHQRLSGSRRQSCRDSASCRCTRQYRKKARPLPTGVFSCRGEGAVNLCHSSLPFPPTPPPQPMQGERGSPGLGLGCSGDPRREKTIYSTSGQILGAQATVCLCPSACTPISKQNPLCVHKSLGIPPAHAHLVQGGDEVNAFMLLPAPC